MTMNKGAEKAFLLTGRRLNYEVEQLKAARREALRLACGASIDYNVEKVQTSFDNRIEKRLVAYSEYSRMLDEKTEELIAYRAKMLKLIEELSSSTYRTLLIARYINCRTWEEIAEDMGYDVRHVHRIHGAALQKFKDVMERQSVKAKGRG